MLYFFDKMCYTNHIILQGVDNMGEYVRQHTVPQIYLRSFTASNGKCFVYDKINDKHFTAAPKDIMHKHNFYDFLDSLPKPDTGHEPDPKFIEKILGSIDGFYSKIKSVISVNTEGFTPEGNIDLWFKIYKFIAIQMIRTPRGREMLLKTYDGIIKKDIPEEYKNVLLAKELINTIKCDNETPVILEFLLQEFGHICIGINETGSPLISSDTPTMLIKDEKYKDYIYFPVTPNRCLLLYPKTKIELQYQNVFDDIQNKKIKINSIADIAQELYRREKELYRKNNPLVKNLSSTDVLKLNTVCYILSSRQIISSEPIVESTTFIKK